MASRRSLPPGVASAADKASRFASPRELPFQCERSTDSPEAVSSRRKAKAATARSSIRPTTGTNARDAALPDARYARAAVASILAAWETRGSVEMPRSMAITSAAPSARPRAASAAAAKAAALAGDPEWAPANCDIAPRRWWRSGPRRGICRPTKITVAGVVIKRRFAARCAILPRIGKLTATDRNAQSPACRRAPATHPGTVSLPQSIFRESRQATGSAHSRLEGVLHRAADSPTGTYLVPIRSRPRPNGSRIGFGGDVT